MTDGLVKLGLLAVSLAGILVLAVFLAGALLTWQDWRRAGGGSGAE